VPGDISRTFNAKKSSPQAAFFWDAALDQIQVLFLVLQVFQPSRE
jgi:hypothetical protein